MTKNEPLDMKLYNDIKDRVWKMYDKPSAYRSGMLVTLYREAGGNIQVIRIRMKVYRDGFEKLGCPTREQQITLIRIPYIVRLLGLQKILRPHLPN